MIELEELNPRVCESPRSTVIAGSDYHELLDTCVERLGNLIVEP